MKTWQTELYGTPMWLLQTFTATMVLLAISIYLIGKTRFGQQFWHVLRPCLDRKSSLHIIGFVALMILLLLTEVRLNVFSTFMSSGLYTSMQDMNVQAFWLFAGMNAAVVLLRTFNGAVNDFLDQALAIKWSKQLNQVLVSRWLAHKNYYRLQNKRQSPDNIDQRIQQDAQEFIANTIEFIRGMLNSGLSSIEFTLVLWGLAGILAIFGIDIPHGIVFLVFIVVILATCIAMWIGKPLIQYNYENERLNGDYRYSLIRVRDHAESVAFYNGEPVEHDRLSQNFVAIIKNRWRIARQSVTLSGFNDMFSQGIQLLPIILQAPRLFAGQIKIGDIHQTVQVFVRLQRSLSFFRLFYKQFTSYRARLERLSGFLSSLEYTPHPQQPTCETNESSLHLENVALLRPSQEVLIENINLSVKQGESLLIKGPSGCGKTSLLRLIAGLWAFGGAGRIEAPAMSGTMFVPQRPYVPQGSLQQALCYPNTQASEAQILQVLDDCKLVHLAEHINKVKDWQHILSPGELQRLAYARILLAQPKMILLDEATAALDEPTEAHLYQLIRQRLPDSIIVSIGHRSTLDDLHHRSVHIVGGC
ncbi:ABC transporter ATP-binding protein/permease [Kingella kingae]|uniref:ABC transporter ATP-binding protein/permease n=1 Tax=Kingella kingae TaxID=504 RepID=UPI000408205E|nr:ABC transporter ATP-binding protein/permease [Kingella kingae]MDK4575227.1 ABC transporter ATP-binding protein/permease [Kingella kingae]MDK4607344.1 ABC transporter ATP-binding protein/permease [Kingella kingae]